MIPENIQDPKFPQYTNLALKEGLFDQLMSSVDFHLDKQFKSNRLTGADYAKVYVGSIQGVMQNTTQYLLGIMLIDEQKQKAQAEIELVEKQTEKMDVEIDLLELEKIKLRYQIEEMLPLEKQKLEWEVLRTEQEYLLLKEQILKVIAEVTLINAQVSLTNAQTSLAGKQEDKIDKEIEFMTYKILTEKANTISGVAATDSLIGKQMSLLTAQKLGFAGDLKIKAGKLHADYDAVAQGVLEIPENTTLAATGSGAAGFAGEASTIANHIEAA